METNFNVTGVQELANRMLLAKNSIEMYAQSLGYKIDIDKDFDYKFTYELTKKYPILKYIFHFKGMSSVFKLKNGANLPEDMVFAINNPEAYVCQCLYKVIEAINDKKTSVKISYEYDYFTQFLSVFKINPLLINRQKNGKIEYHFDMDGFNKIKSVLMYSNEYTKNIIANITDTERNYFKDNYSMFGVISKMTEDDNIAEETYKHINKFLLKQALETK